MALQSFAQTVMELSLALAATAASTYDNPNGVTVELAGPSPVMAGELVELDVRMEAQDPNDITALGVSVEVPAGWDFIENSAMAISGPVPPVSQQVETEGGEISFAWFDNLDAFPYQFTFMVQLPAVLDETVVHAFARYRLLGDEHLSAVAARDLSAEDGVPPVITLIGGDIVAIEAGQTYEDPGWEATDNIDGDITNQVVVGGDTVDPSTVGDYIVTYNVTDSSGNSAVQVTRLVQVVPPDTTAKGFFLCGGSGSATGSGDLAAVLMAALAILGLTSRSRMAAPARARRSKQDEQNG